MLPPLAFASALTHPEPILLGLASAATWGAADFAGGLAARRAPPSRVIFVAHGSSALLLAALVLLLHPPGLAGFPTAWSLLSGASGGVALMLFYQALALGEMGLSAALAGLLTAALPVAVAYLRSGRPGAWQLAGFAVAALAIGLIGWAPGETMRSRTFILATIAGICFGIQLVVLHIVSEYGSVLRALTLSRTGAAAIGAAAMLLAALRQPSIRPRATAHGEPSDSPLQGDLRLNVTPARPPLLAATAPVLFLLLAASAGLLDSAGNGLYMTASLLGRLDVAAVLASLYPGSTILLAAWLLKERTTALQTAGMLLALVAVVLISL